jgi:hypothetical protein
MFDNDAIIMSSLFVMGVCALAIAVLEWEKRRWK